jgi:site-specific recombinase XerD
LALVGNAIRSGGTEPRPFRPVGVRIIGRTRLWPEGNAMVSTTKTRREATTGRSLYTVPGRRHQTRGLAYLEQRKRPEKHRKLQAGSQVRECTRTNDGGAGRITLGAAVSDFLDDCRFPSGLCNRTRPLSEHTVSSYDTGLRALIQHLGKDKPIDTITNADLRKFVADLQRPEQGRNRRGYSPKTVKIRQQTLTAFFSWLREADYPDHNPAENLRRVAVPDRITPPIELRDIQRMIDHIDKSTLKGVRNRLLLLLMADTGGRVSEITGIRLVDIDLEALRIKVVGKGGDERFLHISTNTRGALRSYIRRQAQAESSPYLFPSSQEPDRPLSRGAVYKMVRKVGEAAGVPNAHPHRFRNSFVSFYIARGG